MVRVQYSAQLLERIGCMTPEYIARSLLETQDEMGSNDETRRRRSMQKVEGHEYVSSTFVGRTDIQSRSQRGVHRQFRS